MSIWDKILNIIYPDGDSCLYCGREIDFHEIDGLCQDCLGGIEFVENFCQTCGRSLPDNNSQRICYFCSKNQPFYNEARSIALYQGRMRDLIIEFKYEKRKDLYKPLGHLLSLYVKEYFNINFHYIIPIPLHKKRENERGYNQVELLAEELGNRLGINLLKDLLLRVKNTPPLFDLGLVERKEVIKDSFSLSHSDRVLNSNVLLVDDIFTTGTTVNEAARVLKNGGVKRVFVITLATGLVK